MKILVPLFVGILFAACGCSLVSIERYVHEPTAELPYYVWQNQALPSKFIPPKGEVLMVPDFRTFTASFAGQSSHLKIFTTDKRSLFIESAELEVSEKSVRQSLTLNVTTQPARLEKGDEVWVAYVSLFIDDRVPERNFEFSKIQGADQLILIIRWRDGDKAIETRFPLRRVVRKEAAWVT